MTVHPFTAMIAEVGRTLAARRRELGLSLRAVQARSGVDIGTLSLYERGVLKNGHRLDLLTKIAIALDIPLMTILAPFMAYVDAQRASSPTERLSSGPGQGEI